MKRSLKVDKAIYLVDDGSKTYTFLNRNPRWKELDAKENQRNKRHLDGFKRIEERQEEDIQVDKNLCKALRI